MILKIKRAKIYISIICIFAILFFMVYPIFTIATDANEIIDVVLNSQNSNILNQQWLLEKDGNTDYFRLKNLTNNKYLTKSNNIINLIDLNNSDEQLWKITKNQIMFDAYASKFVNIQNKAAVDKYLTNQNDTVLSFTTQPYAHQAIILFKLSGGWDFIDGGIYSIDNYYQTHSVQGSDVDKNIVKGVIKTKNIDIFNQQWLFEKDGDTEYFRLKNLANNKYLTKIGVQINLLDRCNNNEQLWKITKNQVMFDAYASKFVNIQNKAAEDKYLTNQSDSVLELTAQAYAHQTMILFKLNGDWDFIDGEIYSIDNYYQTHSLQGNDVDIVDNNISKIVFKPQNTDILNQQWLFEKDGDTDYFRLKNKSTNKYLTKSNSVINLKDLNNTNEQLWKFEKNNEVNDAGYGKYVNIKNKAAGSALLTNENNTALSFTTPSHPNSNNVLFVLNTSWDSQNGELYFIKSAQAPYYCLQGNDEEIIDNTYIKVSYSNSEDVNLDKKQLWKFEKVIIDSIDYFRLKNYENNKYLTLKGFKIELADKDENNDAQLWEIKKFYYGNSVVEIKAVNISNKTSRPDELKLLTNLNGNKVNITSMHVSSAEVLFKLNGGDEVLDNSVYSISPYNTNKKLQADISNELVTSGVNYYFSNLGDNNNNGLSAEKPFKTLSKINEIELKHGTRISLLCGDTFNESIELKDKIALQERHIIFTSYGDGAKPIISLKDTDNSISVFNCQNILFEKLSIISEKKNSSTFMLKDSTGIVFKSCDIKINNTTGIGIDSNDMRVFSNESQSNNLSIINTNIFGGSNGVRVLNGTYFTISNSSILNTSQKAIDVRNCESATISDSTIQNVGLATLDNQSVGIYIVGTKHIEVESTTIDNVKSGSKINGDGIYISGTDTSQSIINIIDSKIKNVDGSGIYLGPVVKKDLLNNIKIDNCEIENYARNNTTNSHGVYFEDSYEQTNSEGSIKSSFILYEAGKTPYFGWNDSLKGIKGFLFINNSFIRDQVEPIIEEPIKEEPIIEDPIISDPESSKSIDNTNKPQIKKGKLDILVKVVDIKKRPLNNKTFGFETAKAFANTNSDGYVLFNNIYLGKEKMILKENNKLLSQLPIEIISTSKISFKSDKIFLTSKTTKITVTVLYDGKTLKIIDCREGILLDDQNNIIIIILIFIVVAILIAVTVVVVTNRLRKKKAIPGNKEEEIQI